jgi:DNA-directed RNA polymerase I, II, and III subunit RPABC1
MDESIEKAIEEQKHYDPYFIDIFRAWITCCEMLKDRGYTIPSEFESIDNNDFYKLYQNTDAEPGFNSYDILGTKNVSNAAGDLKGTKKILVKFTLDNDSISRNDIIAIRKKVSETYDEGTSIIYILKNKPNTFVYKAVTTEVNTVNMIDELFLYTEVIFNRTKHRLVPKHVLLTEAEKKDLLLTYDCKDTQIPRMVTSDFVCRYFGAKPGDMFKIDRPSPSSGIYITYRVVK